MRFGDRKPRERLSQPGDPLHPTIRKKRKKEKFGKTAMPLHGTAVSSPDRVYQANSLSFFTIYRKK